MQKSLTWTYLQQHIFFQARFFLALRRLLSPNGMLHSDDMTPYELGKLKAA
jgi:hypothetical protein